ncbi:MAG: LamG-like jellyroll fold domain-containing protein [Pirellulales bacterium]
MARQPTDALYAEVNTPGTPFTVSAWFYPTESHTGAIIGTGNGTSTTNFHCVELQSSGELEAISVDDSSNESAATTNTATINGWNHGCGIFTAADDRRVILNGDWDASGTDDSSVSPGGIDVFAVALSVSSIPNLFSGRLAEAAVWSEALSQREVEALAQGASPLLVRPHALAYYWDLVEGLHRPGLPGVALSDLGSSTVVEHPRVLYAAPPLLVPEVTFFPKPPEVIVQTQTLQGRLFQDLTTGMPEVEIVTDRWTGGYPADSNERLRCFNPVDELSSTEGDTLHVWEGNTEGLCNATYFIDGDFKPGWYLTWVQSPVVEPAEESLPIELMEGDSLAPIDSGFAARGVL